MSTTNTRHSDAISFDLPPMEARQVADLPAEPGWQYEPKWDGFRCIVHKRGKEVRLVAKSGKQLGRFFPEVVAVVAALPQHDLVLDGELVISVDAAPSFDALQMRLHPAASRITRLSRETPAALILFDCLLRQRGRPLLEAPFEERRLELVKAYEATGGAGSFALTECTRDRATATRWLEAHAPGRDGVVAKRLDLPYRPGERAMLKVKHLRTADCVVGGFRYETDSRMVASLLLGLYDAAGLLHHVGFTSGIADRDKPELTRRLEALIEPPGFTGDAPGGPSRWSMERSTAWQPLAPRLVVEVRYDHVTAHRFRHGTKLVRWRPDKAPRQCNMDQIGE